MKLRPKSPQTAAEIGFGTVNLRQALSFFLTAGCPKVAAKIRRALKSADGARRHAERRPVAVVGRALRLPGQAERPPYNASQCGAVLRGGVR